ncbi:ClpXP protease specificity-enhancing factor SspB [Rhodobacteraceae bacterium]|nr:ClpXP protease specificity-enhancing factor SspB [Paracoccaceae bacterium]
MTQTIDYGTLMHRAMRGLIQEVLQDVTVTGLPGQHHFFITFDTMHPDVEIADWLSDRYPEEMTIVMQHWYDNLEVTDEGFSVTLNFGDTPEPLYVPYDSIRTFVDPSVEFGLRFETQEDDAQSPVVADNEPDSNPDDATLEEEKPKASDVVSLDSFRK